MRYPAIEGATSYPGCAIMPGSRLLAQQQAVVSLPPTRHIMASQGSSSCSAQMSSALIVSGHWHCAQPRLAHASQQADVPPVPRWWRKYPKLMKPQSSTSDSSSSTGWSDGNRPEPSSQLLDSSETSTGGSSPRTEPSAACDGEDSELRVGEAERRLPLPRSTKRRLAFFASLPPALLVPLLLELSILPKLSPLCRDGSAASGLRLVRSGGTRVSGGSSSADPIAAPGPKTPRIPWPALGRELL